MTRPIPSEAASSDPREPGLGLSVLIPVYNEAANVVPLHAELTAVLGGGELSYELIFVDDGSTDGTAARLAEIQDSDPEHVLIALLRRNCGQTAALSAALDLARGDVLVPIDGDRQNDPADIPRLLARLDDGYDVVSGWRRDRKDPWLTRKLPSMIANRLVARLSGVALHDFGCTLKAYRRRVLEGVRLYGEMHRFIPIFATWQGALVSELVVNHRPRAAGRSKYGLGRTFNVVLDLLLIRFFYRYAQRPMHLFGRIGIYSILLSMLSFGGMLYYKYLFPILTGERKKDFVETPLPSLVILFFMAGVISILMDLQAEMVMRTYYESQAKTTYLLGEIRRGRRRRPAAEADDDGQESAGPHEDSGGVHAPETAAVWSAEARVALGLLGMGESQLQSLTAGKPVAFTLWGAAEGTIAVAQFTMERRLRVGIYTIQNVGGRLGDLMSFEAKAQAAAKALGARELELLGIEITNPKLQAVLERGGFTPTTIPVPEELGGGTFNAISRVEPVE